MRQFSVMDAVMTFDSTAKQTNPTGGQYTDARPARQIQSSLRVVF